MKKVILTSVFLSLISGVFAQISPSEKQVLVDLYTTTNGESWSQSWDLQEAVSEWYGVTIEENNIIGIKLMFNNLEGSIPASICQLENLKWLELSFNKINGALPKEIGDLSQLEILAFNSNYLSGSIPSSIGNLNNLKQLHLSSNNFTGTLPISMNNLNQLEVFNVFDNQLKGEIPIQLVYNKNLKELLIAKNNFTNIDIFPTMLLINSGQIYLEDADKSKATNNIIAIETSDDEN